MRLEGWRLCRDLRGVGRLMVGEVLWASEDGGVEEDCCLVYAVVGSGSGNNNEAEVFDQGRGERRVPYDEVEAVPRQAAGGEEMLV